MPLIALKPSQRLVDIVGALGGTWAGYVATCRCPTHADGTPSLSIRQGHDNFLVHCFAGCDPADVLREIGRIRSGHHYQPPEEQRAARTANIDRLWNSGQEIGGTLGDRYLALRKIPGAPDVRFHPRCPHGPRPRTVFKPALLVAVREGRALNAIQRIFLDPITARYTEKATLGQPGRGAWKSASPSDTLAIAEGFEDAQAFALLHGIPTWAALGARRLDQLLIPDQVRHIIIAEDVGAEGSKYAAKAEAHYRSTGRTVERRPPPAPFGDWAEVIAADA